MAATHDGTLACTWLDLREKGTTLYLAISRDGGASWSDNRLVYASPSGTICECCHPSLAFDPKGRLYVMFRNSLIGNRDMYLTSSTNLTSFDPTVKLGLGFWPINACPMDGGMISVGPDGGLSAAWRRQNSVYVGSGTESELLLAEGRNPWIASSASGNYVVWQKGPEVLVSGPSSAPLVVAERGIDPVVAPSPDGKLVVAAWNEAGGIRAARLYP